MSLVLDTEPGSIWGSDQEILDEVKLNKDGKTILWVLHTSPGSLEKYREKLRSVDAIAKEEGQEKVSRGEHRTLINGIEVTRVDFCGFTEIVDCSFVRSDYYFLMKDGTYIVLKGDPWWGDEEAVSISANIANTFQYGTEVK